MRLHCTVLTAVIYLLIVALFAVYIYDGKEDAVMLLLLFYENSLCGVFSSVVVSVDVGVAYQFSYYYRPYCCYLLKVVPLERLS